MDDKEFKTYQDEEAIILSRKDGVIKDSQESLKFNLDGYRPFLLTLASFSLAILGGSVAGIDKINISTMWPSLFLGVICLIITAVMSVSYLVGKYYLENKDITEYFNFQRDALIEIHNMLVGKLKNNRPFSEYQTEYFNLHNANRVKEEGLIKKYRDKSPKHDRQPLVITGFFIVGFISFAISFLAGIINKVYNFF